MPDLPPDIITDILIRLPVKSLLPFRCISKLSCSQIDGPDFTKLHLNHTKSRRRVILSLAPPCMLYSLDHHSLYESHEIDNPLASDGWKMVINIIGSCNGLIRLFKSHEQIMLWNPSTRKHLNMCPPAITFPETFTFHVRVYGFGYDSLSDDYKLVRINQFQRDFRYNHSDIFAYSMKLNTWRPMSSFPYFFSSCRCGGTFLQGALHFIVKRGPALCMNKNNRLIIAIDLADSGNEYHYRELSHPPDFFDSVNLNLGVLNDSLCVTCCSKGGLVNVWVMKDYGAIDSWTVLFSVSHEEDSWNPCSFIKPLAMSNDDSDFVFQMEGDELIKVDMKKGMVESLRVQGSSRSFEADVYVESC